MGSDESHFNDSLVVRDRERRAEARDSNRGPSAYQPNALPLGHSRLTTVGDDDVGLNVLACRADILETNCNTTVTLHSPF